MRCVHQSSSSRAQPKLWYTHAHAHARLYPLQDTITGFLLAGVGNVDLRKKTNFLAVDSSRPLLL